MAAVKKGIEDGATFKEVANLINTMLEQEVIQANAQGPQQKQAPQLEAGQHQQTAHVADIYDHPHFSALVASMEQSSGTQEGTGAGAGAFVPRGG